MTNQHLIGQDWSKANQERGKLINDLVNPTRLATYLADDVPELRNALPIVSIERIGQGQSNLTFRVTLTNQMVILRRPPSGPLPPSAHDVLREFRVMSALLQSSVPIPRPIAACVDLSVIGVPFYLMEALPGEAIHFDLPPALATAPIDARHSIGEQLVDALATLHMTDPTAVGLADLGKPTHYMARQLRRWKGQLEYARTRPVPNLDWTAEWLERN